MTPEEIAAADIAFGREMLGVYDDSPIGIGHQEIYRRMGARAREMQSARISELEAELARVREALDRISAANPRNTNSHTAESAFSWCGAVANTALNPALKGRTHD